MTDEAYERRERAMAFEARALMLMCDECSSVYSPAPNDVTVPPTVHVSEAARVIGRWVESAISPLEVELARLRSVIAEAQKTFDALGEFNALYHSTNLVAALRDIRTALAAGVVGEPGKAGNE